MSEYSFAPFMETIQMFDSVKEQVKAFFLKYKITLIALIVGFLLGTAVTSSKAASMEAHLGKNTIITLFDTPCENKAVLDQIKPEYHQQFQAGMVVWGEGKRELCWTISDGDVVILDETGDGVELPILMFAPEVKKEGI